MNKESMDQYSQEEDALGILKEFDFEQREPLMDQTGTTSFLPW